MYCYTGGFGYNMAQYTENGNVAILTNFSSLAAPKIVT